MDLLLLSNFVVHDGLGGRVVIHRTGCPLLDSRYDDGGDRHPCSCFDDAKDKARRLAGGFHRVCGWCRPEPCH